MDMRPPLSRNWQYINQDLSGLVDPRLIVAKHMTWALPTGKDSTWNGVEPDNYNLAIYDTKPHDFVFMQHQCFYRLDRTFNYRKCRGWMSLYVAEERLQTILFNREILKLQPLAVWKYSQSKPIRIKRTLLDRENNYNNRSSDNFSTEERLFQMGYYENLQNKYFDGDEKFIKVVGRPRGAVLNYQPEVDNYDSTLEES